MNNETLVENVAAYTVQEFCDAYRISKPKFYRMVRNGEAPQSIKIGNVRRIPISAVKAWEERFLADSVVSPEDSQAARDKCRGA